MTPALTPALAEVAPDAMNWIGMLGLLLGGLAIFLLGLEWMTAGLKAIAGARLQTLLARMTANRLRGLFAGAAVTALLNSSTITTVLMVGFVSAGLMSLGQSVPMIMGANIGSTFTAQMIAFDVSKLTPFMLALGFLLHAFSGREILEQIGRVILGLGLLFLGIQFMGEATHPLRTYKPFIDAMQQMRNPLVGIAVGAVFTAVVQSSAATLAIVIALGSQGLLPLEAGIALILGANVGTCGTALLAAIGKPAEALQVGLVHLIFNVAGVLFWVFFIPQMADIARLVSPSYPELEGAARLAAETPRQVANIHTIFSVASTVVLIWFAGPIAWLARKIAPSAPKPDTTPGVPIYLDEAFLTAPALGFERVSLELERLGGQIVTIVKDGTVTAVDGGAADISRLLEKDREGDQLTAAILQYIGRLSQVEHTDADSQRMIDLAQIATTLESIGEIVTVNLVSVTQQRLASGSDVHHLRDDTTAHFAQSVIGSLQQAVATIAKPDARVSEGVIAAKADIEAAATAARLGLLGKLDLTDSTGVMLFRLSTDVIEQFRQIARLARNIATLTVPRKARNQEAERS